MKKTAITLTACAIIAGGFTGCGNAEENQGAAPNRYNTNYDQTGYNDQAGRRGEGPMTDMMTEDDQMRRGAGTYGRNNNNNNNGYRGQIGDRPGMVGERGMLNSQNVNDGGADNTADNQNMNNNGSADGNNGQASNIEKQVEGMEGIDDARAIVRGQDVVLGIDTPEEGKKAEQLAGKVKSRVKSKMQNKNVHVTFDSEKFGDIQQLANDMENGTGLNEAGDTINNMINDIGNAARRPFENS
ncbi:YhcN/YlaJ family sporulation lipoprotein [Salibacterium halotolerans]|uniref:Sporulation lipoprotein YhcN/YlaJ (Spore_YhcN_YlaJ) n=1 Tax=Salibacterium halotolerans TaxID=1884432 RepID=A0A1I5UFJ8_9BACI|nr:YhcN/YlaJ family sporulation lipoprotein [Salibacterium halotolerans]SFP94035.1 Sporulation lipoprotein YhcN/YlaJ (Spore_YhcN_YlaJ) [Salibacterium halotolerans]